MHYGSVAALASFGRLFFVACERSAVPSIRAADLDSRSVWEWGIPSCFRLSLAGVH